MFLLRGGKRLKRILKTIFFQRGQASLTEYLRQRGAKFNAGDIIERSFAKDGVVIDGARLTGKIDKISRSDTSNPLVVDFKTGKSTSSWQGKDDFEKIKLHRYSQQLMFYKLLVENSATYSKRFVIEEGVLEFVEPDDNKQIIDLSMKFGVQELARLKALVQAVWQHIMRLDFPDVSAYSQNQKGSLAFEDDLLEGRI